LSKNQNLKLKFLAKLKESHKSFLQKNNFRGNLESTRLLKNSQSKKKHQDK
jgi:hypothetical protein